MYWYCFITNCDQLKLFKDLYTRQFSHWHYRIKLVFILAILLSYMRWVQICITCLI